MRDKLIVFFKSLIVGKKSISSIWKIIYVAIGYISFVFTCSVLVKNLTGCNKLETMCQCYWGALVGASFLLSLVHNHERTVYKRKMKDSDLQIEIRVSDIFSVNATSYVIPTNSYFRTIMEGDYVSPESVQGAFQLKYFKDNLQELDNLIQKNLMQQKIEGQKCVDIHGDVMKYPLGTVAKVDYNSKHYYFVAINDVNMYGKPENQGYANIDIAFKGLLDTIKLLGHCDDLAMPLIGTGRAAIRPATIERVIEGTINYFESSEDKIARKLTICIRPKDYLEGRVDMKKIMKYLDYKSEFN